MLTKKIVAIVLAIAIAVSGTIIGVTAHNVKKAKEENATNSASSEEGSKVSIPDDLTRDEKNEAKASAEKVETAFSLNELELQNELAHYGLTEAVLNENSYPRNSGGEGLTTGFSFTDKGKGTYTFQADKVKEELMSETLNPTFVSARLQCLFEKGDPIVKYLEKTKEFTEKLKTEPMSYWLKKDEAGNIQYRKNDKGENEMYLNEEYLRGALAVCYLNDDGFSFSTDYLVWTGKTPDSVVTWRKDIVNDEFDFDNDLKPVRDGNYKEAHKWASFLVVRQVLKNGKVISEEIFDLYDKAPCIFFVKEKEEEPTTTVKEGKGDVPTTKKPEPTTKKTTEPSTKPTTEPTTKKTTEPSTKPTTEPTTKKTTEPSTKPTTEPTTKKTTEPSTKPTTEPTTKKTNPPKDKSKDPVNQGNAKKGGGANLITDLAGAFQELMPEKSTTGPIYVTPDKPKSESTTKPTTKPATTKPTTAPAAVPAHKDESNYKDNKGNDVKINDDTVFDGKIAMPD